MKKKGFTLVELLVVIAIIAVLASILIVTVGYVKKRAKVAQTSSLIKSIEQAMASYSGDTTGIFPPGQDNFNSTAQNGFTGNNALVLGLCTPAEDGGEKNGPYLNLKGFGEYWSSQKGGPKKALPSDAQIVDKGGSVEVIDSFKFSIRYRSQWYLDGSGKLVKDGTMVKDYDIMSVGPDKLPNTGDDIKR